MSGDRVEIGRVVLDGAGFPPQEAERFRAVLADELARLLDAGPREFPVRSTERLEVPALGGDHGPDAPRAAGATARALARALLAGPTQ